MDQKRKMKRKYIRLKTTLVFIFIFLAVWCVIWIINQSQERREKLKATYTAESTVSRVESQLSKYLAESDLMKRIVEKEYDIDNEQFDKLAELMQEDEDVIEARELAEDGVVSRIYPMEGNEAAMGLDTLQNPARKKEARLARLSGEYTIAGPYELVQGGTGALLFDPAYITDQNGEEKFWGFSILVMNWDNFIQEVELEKLEEAGYDYQIWKKDLYTGEKIVIDESENSNLNNSLEVACSVPNDTWYFEIVPENGWITVSQKVFGVIISIALAVMASVGYWQYKMRRYKDILHEEELEKAAIEARMANEAKTRFLFYMSHDIRTPMNAIVGLTAIAGANIESQDRVVECLGKITKSSRHLLGLINEVLDMARIESGRISLAEEDFSLPELVDNLLTITKPAIDEHKHQLEAHVEHIEHEAVCGDSLRIQQVFVNLMSNAVKYTPDGGKITLTIKEKPNGFSELGCYEFSIEDNGIGMTPEFQKIMFEPFSRADDHRTTKVQGTGLGMAIARNIVNLMNGDIQVESAPNKGTKITVTVYLKLQKNEKEQEKELLDLPVLVVDDDKTCCESTVATLQEIGIAGEWVLTGKEAVERCYARHETNSDYFAVILDWKMPEMDGIATARKIRERVGEDVTIIILTSFDFSEIEEEARAAGVNAFMAKPLFRSRLTATLRQFTSGKKEENARNYLEDFAKENYADKRILLVEDNELNREIATEIIGMTGVTIDSAENGKIAVEKVMEAPEKWYDLIFMDIQMPIMNGYEATAAIRALAGSRGKVPIIAMTANAFAEDVQLAKNTGMNEHIAKPLDLNKLNDVLKQWL